MRHNCTASPRVSITALLRGRRPWGNVVDARHTDGLDWVHYRTPTTIRPQLHVSAKGDHPMQFPPSPHFTPFSLTGAFNADRRRLDGGLAPRAEPRPDWSAADTYGARTFKGIPF